MRVCINVTYEFRIFLKQYVQRILTKPQIVSNKYSVHFNEIIRSVDNYFTYIKNILDRIFGISETSLTRYVLETEIYKTFYIKLRILQFFHQNYFGRRINFQITRNQKRT